MTFCVPALAKSRATQWCVGITARRQQLEVARTADTDTHLSGCPWRGHSGCGGTRAAVLPWGAWEKLGAVLLGKSVCGFTRLSVLNWRLVWKIWVQKFFLKRHKEKRVDIHNCLPEKKRLGKKKGCIDVPRSCTILHQMEKRK